MSSGSFTVSLPAGTHLIEIRDAGFDGHTPEEIADQNMCPAGYTVNITVLRTVVEIDIKPLSFPNSINLKSRGVIPVAILTTADFDATTVAPGSVMFAGASADHWLLEDADLDGDIDLVLYFGTQETNIASGDTEACLTGDTFGTVPIVGCDSVRPLHDRP